MIIVPDVHGRTFWKDVYKFPKEHIVFLGDYLDPYMFEFSDDVEAGQIRYDAIQNFKEIIEFKKANPERVTLLLGNHDCGYAISENICSCRHDWDNEDEIVTLFNLNWDLFDLAYETTYRGEHIIFSHSGIREDWMHLYYIKPIFDKDDVPFKTIGYEQIFPFDQYFGEFRKTELENVNASNVVSFVNRMYHEKNEKFFHMLAMIPRSRGGRDIYGSMIWESLEYWDYNYWTDYQPAFGTMIFGHTYREYSSTISTYTACIDDREIHFLKDIMEIMYDERMLRKHELAQYADEPKDKIKNLFTGEWESVEPQPKYPEYDRIRKIK